jgi:hypothetical protein
MEFEELFSVELTTVLLGTRLRSLRRCDVALGSNLSLGCLVSVVG